MVRWHMYAVFGALAGAATFFLLLRTATGVAPFLVTGIITGVAEAVITRRASSEHRPSTSRVVVRAGLAFVLGAGVGFGVFALLFAGLVAP